jgi:molybdenum cofactor synthesis domain-containing protein
VRTLSVCIVGDEILAGEVRDLNGQYLFDAARSWGAPVLRAMTVPDDEGAVIEAVDLLRAWSEVVVVSGGIGPTHDDVTRSALARVLGAPLVRHAEAERRLRGFYGEAITAADLSMADLPRGACLVDGLRTSSFGFRVGDVVVLPGVPALFRDIVDGLAPWLGGLPLERAEILTPHREGEIAEVLAAVQEAAGDVSIGSYPELDAGRWQVRIVVRGADAERVHAIRDRVERDLEATLGA